MAPEAPYGDRPDSRLVLGERLIVFHAVSLETVSLETAFLETVSPESGPLKSGLEPVDSPKSPEKSPDHAFGSIYDYLNLVLG